MGQMEKEVMKSIRHTRLNTAIIGTLAVSGVLATGLIVPQVLGAMGKLGLIHPLQKKQNIKKSFSKLMSLGYLTVETGKVRLTQKGEKFAALRGEGKLAPKKPRRWDHKWRILIFDIPEKRKAVRTQIRTTLRHLGFSRLQDSVWVYPYDCEDLITLLKADMRVGKDVLYLIVDKLEHDIPLREHFSLS